jgi:hypothetical protein
MGTQSPLVPLYQEALKAIAITLGQMTLYSVSHPTVKTAIQDTHRILNQILEKVERGEIVYATNDGKMIANGELLGPLAQIPNAVTQLYTRFRLQSIAFKKGITENEIILLCEMASMRAEQSRR